MAAAGRKSKIGTAYIGLVPSFAGFFTAIDREFTQKMPVIMDKVFNDLGKDYGKNFGQDWADAFKHSIDGSVATAINHATNQPIHIQTQVAPPVIPHATNLQPIQLPAPVMPVPHVTAPSSSQSAAAGAQVGQSMGESAAVKFGKALVAGAAALAVADKLKEAIIGGMDLEAGHSKLTAQLNLTAEQSKKISSVSDQLYAKNYGPDRETVNANMKSVVSSIKGAREMSAEQLQMMGADVANLTGTFEELDAKTVSQAASSLINNGVAKDWANAVDIIAAGYTTMGERGDDWIDTLKEYSGDFKQFGLSGEQAFSTINAMVGAGAFYNTDTAADFLREVGIQARSGENAKVLEALGLDPLQIQADANKGGEVWLKSFQKIMEKAKASGNKSLLGELFGTQAEDQLNAVMTTDWSVLTKPIPDITQSAENLDKQLNGNTKATVAELTRAIENLFIKIIQPALDWVTPKLKDMTDWLGKNEWAVTALAIVMGGALVISIAAATAGLWSMAAAAAANPLTWIIFGVIAGIALMIVGFNLLAANWTTIVAVGTQIWGGFMNWLGGVFGGFGQGLADIGRWIGNFFIGIVNGVIGLINIMIDALNSIKFQAPDWMGGFGFAGFGIPRVAEIPALAQGATILPTPGGTLVRTAEAGKPESVVDTGLLNRQLAASANAMENGAGNGQPSSVSYEYNIYQLPGESTQELVKRIEEFKDLRGDF